VNQPTPPCRILAVGTAVPATRFEQAELLALAGYQDALRRNFFLRSGIEGRHLYLDGGRPPHETVDELTARFRTGVLDLATQAVRTTLRAPTSTWRPWTSSPPRPAPGVSAPASTPI
jgi:hypothetical protein